MDEAGKFTAEHTVMEAGMEIRELKHLLEVKDEMLLSALEFFVDYKFSSSDWANKEYAKRIENIDQNEFAKLCKKMGGKTRFAPTLDKFDEPLHSVASEKYNKFGDKSLLNSDDEEPNEESY